MAKLRAGVCISFLAILMAALPAVADIQSARNALQHLEKNVEKITLSNGLRVLLYRRGIAPVFAGAIIVRVGGVNESLGVTGISHLLEHMAFKGTPAIGAEDPSRERRLLSNLEGLIAKEGLPAELSGESRRRYDELQKELDALTVTGEFVMELTKRGAVGLNATTGVDSTNYFMNLPRSAFEYWCWVESERLMHPVMRQFYQELEVVREERRMRNEDDPGGKFYEAMLGAAFVTHPYRNPVIGYDFDLRRLTASMVEGFRKRYYVPGNMVVAVVGDVSKADIAMIEKYFGRIPAGPLPAQPSVPELAQNGERQIVVRASASPQIAIAYKKPTYPHPDDPLLSLLMDILAGSKISPLYTVLVRDEKLLTGVAQFEAPGSAYANLMMFHGTLRVPHTTEEALKAFDRVLDRFLRRKIGQDEFEIARKRVAIYYLSQLDSNQAVALDLAETELLLGDWTAAVRWYEDVMKALPGDVERVARQYLRDDNRTVGRLERET